MYGEHNLPNLSPLMPVASLGSPAFGQQMPVYGNVGSIPQPMTPYHHTSPGSLVSGQTPQSPITPPVSSSPQMNMTGQGYRMAMVSPDMGSNSSSSVSPNMEVANQDSASTSSTSSTEIGNSMKNDPNKDRKRKGTLH